MIYFETFIVKDSICKSYGIISFCRQLKNQSCGTMLVLLWKKGCASMMVKFKVKNVANTEEYQSYFQQSLEQLDPNREIEDTFTLDGICEYTVDSFVFFQEQLHPGEKITKQSLFVLPFGFNAVPLITKFYNANGNVVDTASVVHFTVKNENGELLLNVQALDDSPFIKLIIHNNGETYFIYRIDSVGYSVFEVSTKISIDYIPETFNQYGENFIWADFRYCPINDVLIVYGSVQGHSPIYQFFDFSNPLEVPYTCLGSSDDFEKMLGLTFQEKYGGFTWNDKGEFLLEANYPCGHETMVTLNVKEWTCKAIDEPPLK